MNIIKMEETDVQNLLQFLNRVEIKGFDEVNAFNKIVQTLQGRAREMGKGE